LQPHQPDGVAFDTTQFNTVASRQLADNIRTFDTQLGNLRRDPARNLDMSLLKKFSRGERKYFQIRFETIITIKRVTFASPNLTATSASFGQLLLCAN
jgi:hypothetical protein